MQRSATVLCLAIPDTTAVCKSLRKSFSVWSMPSHIDLWKCYCCKKWDRTWLCPCSCKLLALHWTISVSVVNLLLHLCHLSIIVCMSSFLFQEICKRFLIIVVISFFLKVSILWRRVGEGDGGCMKFCLDGFQNLWNLWTLSLLQFYNTMASLDILRLMDMAGVFWIFCSLCNCR